MVRRALVGLVVAALAGLPAVAVADADAAKKRPRAERGQLKAFSSCGQLVRYGRRHVDEGRGATAPRFFPQPPVVFAPPPPGSGTPGSPAPDGAFAPPAASPERGGSVETSPTNVQEAGVDEPDLVKARGATIFAVAGGRLHALGAGEGPVLLGSLDVPGFGHELLLSGDRLLVLSHDYAAAEPSPSQSSSPAFGGRPVAILSEVDATDPAAMRILRTQRVGGTYLSARLTGDTARVVFSSPARGLAERPLRARLAGWTPRGTLLNRRAGRRATRRLTGCRRVRRARAAYAGVDTLTVLTIDMSKGLPAVDSDAVMASAEIVYASPRNLYVAAQRYVPDPDSPDDRPPATRTDVHKFDISDPAQTVYKGTGEIPGYLLNQFSLSEHKGVLRAASTETPLWWQGREARQSESFVTTLDERAGRLVELGRADGLGRGEQIYAVRFIEDAGFVVTFRQTDPLYALDLSDPTRPLVRGELKILGYSAYLHSVGDDLLLGVGQDATEQGVRQGTQLSLFDVSDLVRPRRLHALSLGSGSSSAVEFDHRAFLWWAPRDLAVFPVQAYGSESPFVGAIGFGVEREAGIAERGRASHDGDDGFSAPILRTFVVDGRLFTLSDRALEVNDLATLAEQGSVALPGPPSR